MKTVLICHGEARLNRFAMAAWLASFSTLTGIVEIRERPGKKKARIKKEIERSGLVRFLDVLVFRLYYRLFFAAHDRQWEVQRLAELQKLYPSDLSGVPVHVTTDPNSAETEAFLRSCQPDLVVARCRFLLKEHIFSVPPRGVFVMHPGICPEYRNAHGCFWALAKRDMERVGMTLLKIDRGVDTGPVFGYYYADFDETQDSHIIIQHRVVYDNLDLLRERLISIAGGDAASIDTKGRQSAVWGQPWMSQYLRWRLAARRRRREQARAELAR